MTGIFPEAVVVESAAGGYGVIDLLSGQLPIVPLYPRGSKEDRASSVCFLVNTGRVAIPESASWVKDFVDELQNFPLCSASDQVDAFVHGLAYASIAPYLRNRIARWQLVTIRQRFLPSIDKPLRK